MSGKMLAYQIDVKRAMPTREYLDRMVDILLGYGYNAIVYEIEDKFRFAKHPAIAHADAPAHEAYRDFSEASRAKGMEVVPLMQSLGHAERVVGLAEYAHLREVPEFAEHYDATNPAARGMVIELFDEIIDVFSPLEFFHVGGDETWQLGRSERLRELVAEKGVGRIYLEHMLPILEHVHARGARPMIWADMILSYPDIIAEIPDYVIMVDWDYSITSPRREDLRVWGGGLDDEKRHANITLGWEEYQAYDHPRLKPMLEKYAIDDEARREHTFPSFYCTDLLKSYGFQVLTAPATRCAGDLIGVPDNGRHLPNCHYFTRKGMLEADGSLVTSWAVRHNHWQLGFFGAHVAARAAEREESFDIESACAEWTKDRFGTELPGFLSAMEKVQKSFRLGQAAFLERMKAGYEKDPASLEATIEEFAEELGGRDAAKDWLAGYRAGCAEAIPAFRAMKEKASRNAHDFDFWIEGAEYNAFCAGVLLVLIDGTLQSEADALSSRLNGLIPVSRALFEETFEPASVEEELDERYAFFRALLGAD